MMPGDHEFKASVLIFFGLIALYCMLARWAKSNAAFAAFQKMFAWGAGFFGLCIGIALAHGAYSGLESSWKSRSGRESGYRVVKYDGEKAEWTFTHSGTWDGEYQVNRITAECVLYRRGDLAPVGDARGCNLRVGELIVENLKDSQHFSNVVEMSNWLVIQQGVGPNQIAQTFTILRNELVK
jgi:hypothetical protein